MNRKLIILSIIGGLIIVLATGFFVAMKKGILADVLPESARNVTIARVSTLEKVNESYQPDPDKQLTEVNLIALKGQKVSFSFVMNAKASPIALLGGSNNKLNFTLQKQHLSSSSGDRIQLANIDDRLVHLWTQKQFDPKNKRRVFNAVVPELLVKSEKTDFFSDNIGTAEAELLNSAGTFDSVAPTNIDGVLEANKTKQISVDINVPPATNADNYSGKINLVSNPGQANERIFKTFRVNLQVVNQKIADFNDANVQKIAGCYTNDKVAINAATTDSSFISRELFNSRLLTIRKLGCSAMTLRADEATDLKSELEIVSSLGFKGPVIINYNSGKRIAGEMQKKLISLLKTKIISNPKITVPLMWYAIDEPNEKTIASGDNISPYDLNKEKIDNLTNILKSIGVSQDQIMSKITTSATTDTFNSLAAEGYDIQMPIHAQGYNCTVSRIPGVACAIDFLAFDRQLKTNPSVKNNLYYFQSWMEDPIINRYLSGFGFSSTEFKGFFANPIYGYYNRSYKPIYKEDLSNTLLPEWKKQMMTFYPAKDGFIPTVQSQGLMEGITDSQLFITYKRLQQNSESCTSSSAATPPEELANKYAFDNTFGSLPAGITISDIEDTRQIIVTAIAKLVSAGCTAAN